MPKLAIFGADSLEGEQLLEALAGMEPAVDIPFLFSVAEHSEPMMYAGRPVAVENPANADFAAIDIAVFLPVEEPYFEALEAAEKASCAILDASDVLAQRGDAPLYYAGAELAAGERIVAIADAASSHIAAFLSKTPQLRRLDVALNQSVSALGKVGVEALAAESARLLNGQQVENKPLGVQIAFNVFPAAAGRSAEVEQNLAKLLSSTAEEATEVSCQTTVVPVFYGNLYMLKAEYHGEVPLAAIREALFDDPRFRVFPNEDAAMATPAELGESDCIDITNMSLDRANASVLRCALVADNLRKGVTFNIIEALRILIKIDT